MGLLLLILRALGRPTVGPCSEVLACVGRINNLKDLEGRGSSRGEALFIGCSVSVKLDRGFPGTTLGWWALLLHAPPQGPTVGQVLGAYVATPIH